MLDNCSYNRIKVLHDLSCVAWYIDQFCKKDAAGCGKDDCHAKIDAVKAKLDALVEELNCCEK